MSVSVLDTHLEIRLLCAEVSFAPRKLGISKHFAGEGNSDHDASRGYCQIARTACFILHCSDECIGKVDLARMECTSYKPDRTQKRSLEWHLQVLLLTFKTKGKKTCATCYYIYTTAS